MAKRALEKLDEQLNCTICLDTYTDPKLLQCIHVYCRQCLVRLVMRDQCGQLIISCPTCRKITPVPETGVSGLQSAFHINYLLEIRDSFEKIGNSAAARQRLPPKDSSPAEKVILKCSDHDEKVLEYYCETCGKVICLKCILKGGKHLGHVCIVLDEAFDKYQGEIMSSLDPVEKQLTTINSALMLIDKRCEEIIGQRDVVESKVNDYFKHIYCNLDARKTELINQLNNVAKMKLKNLAIQRNQIEMTQVQLGSCIQFVRESIRKGNRKDILMMKNAILKQVKELIYFQPASLKASQPCSKADITFSASSDIASLYQTCGKINTSETPDPSKCHIINRNATEMARVGEITTLFLQTVSSMNRTYEGLIGSFECKLVSEITGTVGRDREVNVCKVGLQPTRISYKPTIKGRHQLHVKINDQHIKESPFVLSVISPIEKLGIPLQTVPIKHPMGVAVDHSGKEVVVTNTSTHCISIFSPGGEVIQSFGRHGSAPGQFNYPFGVAMDSGKNILVADTYNNRIQKFAADGKFLTTVGNKGNGILQFACPWGITFNARNNKVYVTDTKNHRIQILNSDLTLSDIVGYYGNGKGQFIGPHGIACDSTGRVYVADHDNHRIQVLTAEGKFLKIIGVNELNAPDGVAIDVANRVYVSEWGKDQVSVFTSAGVFLRSFGKRGMKRGEVAVPRGLAVDNSGVVYLCDNYNNRLQMF